MIGFDRSQMTRCPRRGVTLLELLLSIAVLGSLAAILLPSMAGLLLDRRLQRGADLVQIEFDRLRLAAMRGGHLISAAAAVGDQTIVVSDRILAGDDASGANGSFSALAMGADQAAVVPTTPAVTAVQRQIELPAGVTVSLWQISGAIRQLQTQQDIAQIGSSPNSDDGRAAIYFYPDGTTSDAVIVLTADGSNMAVQLRAVTGRSEVFEPSR